MSQFRYPYPIGTLLEPWREVIGESFGPVVARLLERDQEMEDYLSRDLPHGYLRIGRQTSAPKNLNATPVDIPGMTVTFEVLKGRTLKVTVSALVINSSATADVSVLRVVDELGATIVVQSYFHAPTGTRGSDFQYIPVVFVDPPAGKHTYKVQASIDTSGTLQAESTIASFISVEDIGMLK